MSMVGGHIVVGGVWRNTLNKIPLIALTTLVMGCAVDAPSDGAADVRATTQESKGSACDARIKAHHMHASAGRPTWSGWNIWSNGHLTASHHFVGGETTLTVNARGTYAGGAWPVMTVSVDGQIVGSANVSSQSYKSYAFSFVAPAGRQNIKIEFSNDYYRWGDDRNLYVRDLKVECNAPSCSDGVENGGEEGVDCGGGCAPCGTCSVSTLQAEDMAATVGGAVADGWNIWGEGSIFAVHAFQGPATLEVIARGTYAGSAWPNMEVLVGDQVVGVTSVPSESYVAYRFEYAGGPGTREIRVRFLNDYYRHGRDRNLFVDKVNVLCSETSECPPQSEGQPCDGGICSSAGICVECIADSGCDDGDVCNGAETCSATGSCQAASPLHCDDENECTIDTCDATDGCQNVVAAGGTCGDGGTCATSGACISCQTSSECDDGNVCNGAENCNAQGQCEAGTALSCDDGEQCTADICDEVTGCQNPLAVGQGCSGGVCGPVGACVECYLDEHCEDGGGIGMCDEASACQILDCAPGATGPGVLSGDVVITGKNTDQGLELLSGVTCLDGNLLISGTLLTDLSGLNELRAVTGDLRIGAYYPAERVYGNAQLTSVAGLQNLRSVGGELLFRGPVESLAALARLREVDSLWIEETALPNLVGLEALVDIPGQLITRNNPALASFEGLNHLRSVGADFDSWDNVALASVEALSELTDVGGRLLFRRSQLPSLSGLENLETVGDTLVLVSDDALSSIAALSKLSSVYGIDISSVSQLGSLSGLAGLSSIGHLSLQDMQLSSLSGLDGLNSVDEIYLSGLPELNDLSALSDVTLLRSLTISETGLENLVGLEGLQQAESLSLMDNASLNTLAQLGSLTQLALLSVTGNAMLPQCEADELASRLQVSCECSANDESASCN